MKFIEELDRFRKDNSITSTIDFIENEKREANINDDNLRLLEILNESMGFYRDIEQYNDSYKDAILAYDLLNKIDIDNISKLISYINIANAYRAFNKLNESLDIYNKALDFYNANNLNNNVLLASLYNNLGLLNKIINKDVAINNFNKALTLLKDSKEDIKIGTTYINLAETYLLLDNLDLAKVSLLNSEKYFKNHEDDFHYSSFLILKSRILKLENKLLDSFKTYQNGLAHFDKFQGRGESYQLIYNEYKVVANKLNLEPFTPLLELSEQFFKENFKTLPKDLLDKVVIGLFGYGSECNKLDDLYSIDHDYEPGFIILYKDLSNNDIKRLKNYYDNLPEFYNIYYRHRNQRHYVFSVDEYLNSIGIQDKKVELNNLNLLTNGKIFYNGFNFFKYFREEALINYKLNCPIYICETILLIEQAIYNLCREFKRGNNLNYKYILNNISNKLIDLYYYDSNIPPIHEKERIKLINKDNNIYKLIEANLNNNLDIEELKKELVSILLKNNIIKESDYNYYKNDLSLYKNIIIKFIKDYSNKLDLSLKICNIEWQMHKSLNSADGVVECQTNSPYYLIMRISQHINMSIDFLNSYLSDLTYAKDNNISLPFIKYTFMEENTDKELFNKAKHLLPIISEKRKALQENIISLQIEMLDKFIEKYSEDINYMRTFKSSTDSKYNTSYETYLRAELSSYSEKSVMLYGLNLVDKSKNNINLVEEIVNTSKSLYK